MPRSPYALRPAWPAALALLLGSLLVLAAPAAAQASDPRVVLAFLPQGGDNNPKPVLDRLDARTRFAIGLVSATQGRSSPEQMVLDVSAGSRTSRAVYDPEDAPLLELVKGGDGSGFIFGWNKALERADSAPAEITPGLLASRIAGGAAYAGVAGRTHVEAAVAADRNGDIAEVSLGPAATLAERAGALLRHHRLVVVGLPTSDKGDEALDDLLRARRADDLLMVVQTPPRARVPLLLPMGVDGLGSNGSLTSTTTRLEGIVAGIDIPVTILRHLGIAVPDGVRGQPIRAEGVRDAAGLTAVEARLRVVSGRRTPVLGALAFGWLALVLALGVFADRRGIRAGLRIGALGFLWVPALLLLTGSLAPSRLAEIAIIVVGAFGLGALTDRFVRWPRAPLVPAAVSVVAYCVDLILGSPLIIRSILGVNPRSGSRFYGLGNELEATLTVLLLVGLGALLYGRGEVTAQRGDHRVDGRGVRGVRRRRPARRRRRRRHHRRCRDRGRDGRDAARQAVAAHVAARGGRPGRRARGARAAGPRDRRRRPLHAHGPARRQRRFAVGRRQAPLHARLQRLRPRRDAVHHARRRCSPSPTRCATASASTRRWAARRRGAPRSSAG